jgi:transposase
MLFVQAAQVIMMQPQNWPKSSFGTWPEAASARMQHNKLGVALAKKLARIAWSVLKSQRDFDWKQNETAARAYAQQGHGNQQADHRPDTY